MSFMSNYVILKMSRNLILLILCLEKIHTNTTQSDYEIDSRIGSGYRCSVADYKYMVAIFFNGTFNCGGSLLSSRWVLTARHCIKNWKEPNTYMVVAGVEAPYKEYWGTDMQSSVVKGCYRHPTDDIGLINLQKSIHESPVVGYVTLATYLTMLERKLEDICSNSTIIGWDKQNDQELNGRFMPNMTMKEFDPYLQCDNLPVLSPKECSDKLYEAVKENLTESYFCAVKKSADSCWGESGGPLLCEGIQYGIVSYGHGCDYEDLPGMYVKVFYFETFINTTMENGSDAISHSRSCSAVKHSFLVAIIHQDTLKIYQDSEWECAGSLLTPTWVLTSGYCVMKCETPSHYTVFAGLNDSFKFDPSDKSIMSSKVERCLQPPDQQELKDIALMKLSNGFHSIERVSFIRLVTLFEMQNKNFEEVCSNGTLIGYGRPNNPVFHNLHCDKTAVTSDTQCKKIWSSAKVENHYGCIDGPIGGDCYATLGVPLVCHGIQYGVLSVVDCTDRKNPNSSSMLIAKVYKYDLFLQKMIYDISTNKSNIWKSNGNNRNTPVKMYIFIFYFVLFLT